MCVASHLCSQESPQTGSRWFSWFQLEKTLLKLLVHFVLVFIIIVYDALGLAQPLIRLLQPPIRLLTGNGSSCLSDIVIHENPSLHACSAFQIVSVDC